MSLQPAGIVLALATFITIAVGHVLVRRLHPRWRTRPGLPFFVLGALVLLSSFLVESNLLSGVLGIFAVTFIWDGIEFFRQEKRYLREKAKQTAGK
jgi:drug/metabolite transporter (DMT)-like permease